MDMSGLTQRETYVYWHREKIRFSDTDMIGHVNNVAFAALIESGRVAFTHSGVVTGMPSNLLIVMARIEIDYRAELHWPADIDVGSRLLRIGNSSFSIGNGVFHGDLCAATSITTLVVIDRSSRKSTPIPAAVRVELAKHEGS
jgi:acyl-CoA thioester hydrolase